MTLIERFKAELKAMADTVREKTGSTDPIPFFELKSKLEEIQGGGSGETIPNTIILVDQDGNECVAVLTEEETEITATKNDIRLGVTAVTNDGIVTGEKEIPAYHTIEGYRLIPNGEAFVLPTKTHYDYTKLQVIICPYNSAPTNSVSAEKVVINDNVYEVLSTTAISSVTKNDADFTIDLGITNDSGKSYYIRYFMYKEIY